MSIKSSINKVSSNYTCIVFFYFPYNYKNRVLAYFQARPKTINNSIFFKLKLGFHGSCMKYEHIYVSKKLSLDILFSLSYLIYEIYFHVCFHDTLPLDINK